MSAMSAMRGVLAVVLGALFVYAGVLKMADPLPFAMSVASFVLLPKALGNAGALVLPPFEILAGLAAVWPRFRRVGLLALVLLNAVFLVALGSALARGIPAHCGCFGPGSGGNLWLDLARDVGLLALAGWLYWRCKR